MMFRQGFVLLVAAVAVFSTTSQDVKAHSNLPRLSEENQYLKHPESALLRNIRGLFASSFNEKNRRHFTSKAHNYHARYHLNQGPDKEKDTQTALVSETKSHDQVEQEFSVGKEGGFEQNVHIPAGKEHEVTFHYENGILDIYVKDSQKAANKKINNLRENTGASANTAFVASDDKSTSTSWSDRYTTEETVGLAAMALSVVAATSVLIGAIISLIWSHNRNKALTEAVAPEVEASEESETAPTSVDEEVTEEEYEDESFDSESSSAASASDTDAEAAADVESNADEKQPVLRDEDMESIEARV